MWPNLQTSGCLLVEAWPECACRAAGKIPGESKVAMEAMRLSDSLRMPTGTEKVPDAVEFLQKILLCIAEHSTISMGDPTHPPKSAFRVSGFAG